MNSRSEKSNKILLSDQSMSEPNKNGASSIGAMANLSTSSLSSSTDRIHKSLLQSKLYLLIAISLCLCYFIDVFVGLLLINEEYKSSLTQFNLKETNI
jgi:hypothetical protein